MWPIVQNSLSWPVEVLPIRDRQVQIWSVTLSELAAHSASLAPLLSSVERRRAEAYKVTSHQHRYRVVRGILRCLLGGYLQRDPAVVELTEGVEGKPRLAAEATPPLHFNLSHSGDLAVFGFCAQAEIGVDVEYLDANVNTDVVAATAFSAGELASYRHARHDERLQHFFRLWTRKEARVKAGGLAMAHRYFASAERLPVADLALGEHYVGAVAMRSAHGAPTLV